MKTTTVLLITYLSFANSSFAQQLSILRAEDKNTVASTPDSFAAYLDSMPMVHLRDVTIVSFKSQEEWMMYYKYKSRIQKVMPYVKVATQLYEEIKINKAESKKRDYKHFRKDLEKEMRGKFEKELKDLTTSQGEMLFKLINRETDNNAYEIIKEIKGSAAAWFYQLVGKRWGYNLKENYDPEKERMIELIIRELGPAYKIKS